MGRGKHKDRGHGNKRKSYSSRHPRKNKKGGKKRLRKRNTKANDLGGGFKPRRK